MPDWVVDAIAGACCCRESLVADEEVQVFGAALPREVSTGTSAASQEGGFVRDRRTTGARAAATACWTFGSYRRGEDEGGRIVAGETCDAVLLHVELELLEAGNTKLGVTRAAAVQRQYSIAIWGPAGSWELTCP